MQVLPTPLVELEYQRVESSRMDLQRVERLDAVKDLLDLWDLSRLEVLLFGKTKLKDVILLMEGKELIEKLKQRGSVVKCEED